MKLVISDAFHQALEKNEGWRNKVAQEDPDHFPSLAAGQQPEILWIGCSDSRVPETTILNMKAGDVFVHRNIANILHPGDLSSQSVIEYAVVYLKVKHVVLCGHTSCGGAAAALGNKKLGLIDAWLLPLRSLRQKHLKELSSLSDKESLLKLVELNVKQGVQTLKQNHHIIDAMRDRGLDVHGLIYDIGTGKLKEVDTDEGEEEGHHRTSAFETKA